MYSEALWASVFLFAVGFANAQAPVVDLGYARYQGVQNSTTGINAYYSIPFGQAPVGNLRWRAPLPIEESDSIPTGTIPATTVGPACYQSLPLWFVLDGGPAAAAATAAPQGQSEDCLILNVLTPIDPVSTALPVVVQIHMGGYTSGNGAYSHPGDAIVNASDGNIIHVNIQYRLGVFGFLAGSAVSADGDLNAGLLDQALALNWVQTHISAFGGDPSRVTIWGGSAGGGSVAYHLTAAGGTGTAPFSAAIAEYPWWTPLLNSSITEAQYQTTLQVSNCTDLSCLRSISSESLATFNQAVQNVSYPSPGLGYGEYYFGPVIDGVYILDLPSKQFTAGNFHKVPLLVDRETYEGLVFTNASLSSESEEIADARYIFPSADDSFFTELLESQYPAENYPSIWFQRLTWFGDFMINCPTWQMASALSSAYLSGSSTSSDSGTTVPVYKLLFNAGSQIHTSTIPFLSSTTPGFPEASNQTLAQIMAKYWISFIVDHDPNTLKDNSAPQWPSYESGTVSSNTTFQALDIGATTITVTKDPEATGSQCEFFKSRAEVTSQK